MTSKVAMPSTGVATPCGKRAMETGARLCASRRCTSVAMRRSGHKTFRINALSPSTSIILGISYRVF
jgi:hypothetical protein